MGRRSRLLRAESCVAEAEDVSGMYAQPGPTGTVELGTSVTPKLIMILWRRRGSVEMAVEVRGVVVASSIKYISS